jgi:hypothetical protein
MNGKIIDAMVDLTANGINYTIGSYHNPFTKEDGNDIIIREFTVEKLTAIYDISQKNDLTAKLNKEWFVVDIHKPLSFRIIINITDNLTTKRTKDHENRV